MSPRPSLTETRRTEILAATSATIADRGLCETRIADIADHLGASPALILYYFPSKAALLTEALIYQDQVFHDAVKGELDSAGSATAKLAILIEASCPKPTRGNGEPDGWVLWPAAWEMSRHDPTLAAARARLDESWRNQISAIVDEGIAAGEFDDIDSADFAIQLAALLDGLAIEVMLRDPTVDAARMRTLANGFVEMALNTHV
ncbi:MAG TPA: TetR/AcrR family transcriptional regulator [Acidimicrobiia bacterium]|nr:TetR/AcrR family transcriptional regulator [Acidimicrobiia bacterium]